MAERSRLGKTRDTFDFNQALKDLVEWSAHIAEIKITLTKDPSLQDSMLASCLPLLEENVEDLMLRISTIAIRGSLI